uniref:Retrotransposon protein, putative, Ty1-copia subclass n=1 Tax=Tanacetum cinerariifolium TaxID=118510 RepID=A0A6L2MFF7_TANCI|nr:retrotransposon protein, putative, Ty1-copia subclass [Tanacetum cinerariifolium]
MASFKYDLPLLDRDSKFSLWQVKMRALLAQMDLDDALLGHDKMPSKKTAAALWLKLEQICMTKDLTNKIILKQKLFSYKLQKGGSMMDHLRVFKEIDFDLQSMEIKYDGNRDTLTLEEVYEALHAKEKMKHMVSSKGSSSQAEDSRRREVLMNVCVDELWSRLKNKEKKVGTFKPKTNMNDGEKATFVAVESSKGDAFVAYVGCTKTNDEWILDSACTFHISPNKEWFISYKCIQGGSVLMGDNATYKIKGIGFIQVKMFDGYKYLGEGRVLKVKKGSMIVMKADLKSSNLYHLRGTTIIGPSQEESLGGARYMLTIIDDYSRRVWPYFLKHKSQAFTRFKEWKVMVEKQTAKKVKKLRTDNGIEFCSNEFNSYCKSEGIVRHYTVPYTPQQSGVAERMNRTIILKAHCVLSNACLSKRFWAEAASIACYLINMSPSTAIDKKIPIEVWFNSPANYEDLRVFGCIAYPHADNGKLDPRAIKCIFLVYKYGVKGYKLWCPKNEKVVISTNLIFNEQKIFLENFSTNVRVENQHKTSVQVDELVNQEHTSSGHFGDQDTPIVEEDSCVSQQPQHSIATDRPRRTTKAPSRLLEEVNLIAYALNVAKDIEGNMEPSTYSEAIISTECNTWLTAMHDEMESLDKNEGITPSEDVRFKARLVVEGFSQIPGIDFTGVLSPVVKHSSISTLFSIVAMHDYELEQLDVKTAFSHGELEEDIYMEQPEGFVIPGKEILVCKLKKSLYGLKQSPCQWYKKFDTFMLSQSFKRPDYDICVYFKLLNGSPVYLLLYVDDMLIVATDKTDIEKLKGQLNNEFDMKDLGAAKKIIGIEIIRERQFGKLYLSQQGKSKYGLVGYVDLDYAGDLDKRRSLTGYVFTVGGCAISWKTSLQATTALSTTEAKYMAISEACKEAIWLRNLFNGLSGFTSCTTIFYDSQSAIYLTKDQMFHERTKHIDVRYHFIRGVIAQGDVKIQKTRTHDNPADMMAKPISTTKFVLCSSLVGMTI